MRANSWTRDPQERERVGSSLCAGSKTSGVSTGMNALRRHPGAGSRRRANRREGKTANGACGVNAPPSQLLQVTSWKPSTTCHAHQLRRSMALVTLVASPPRDRRAVRSRSMPSGAYRAANISGDGPRWVTPASARRPRQQQPFRCSSRWLYVVDGRPSSLQLNATYNLAAAGDRPTDVRFNISAAAAAVCGVPSDRRLGQRSKAFGDSRRIGSRSAPAGRSDRGCSGHVSSMQGG